MGHKCVHAGAPPSSALSCVYVHENVYVLHVVQRLEETPNLELAIFQLGRLVANKPYCSVCLTHPELGSHALSHVDTKVLMWHTSTVQTLSTSVLLLQTVSMRPKSALNLLGSQPCATGPAQSPFLILLLHLLETSSAGSPRPSLSSDTCLHVVTACPQPPLSIDLQTHLVT